MITIDLHGFRHYMVKGFLIRKIEELWDTNSDVAIITGHSELMKEEVRQVLDEYKLEYHEDPVNRGMLVTVI